jgi:3-oxoacyl-[acyl-carrier protein] reductase
MLQRFTGRRILVTGASNDSDIGLAVCKRLASEGARLVLVGRRREMLEATLSELPGEDHHVAPFDLYKIDDIQGFLQGLCADAPLNGVVHSASFQGYSPLKTVSARQFDQYMSLNFAAAVMLGKAMSYAKVAGPGAGLVLVGSAAALMGLKGRTLYAASKAALASAAKSMALELAPKQIRVNYIAPAVVMGRRASEQFALLGPEQTSILRSQHPLGFGHAEDVAAAVAFLLSEDSRWITGAVLPVDGGFSAG